jgi:outer membrane lipoprotein
MKRFMVLVGFILLLQGCRYAISPEIVNMADKKITFDMLRSDPDLYRGKLVILGGTIAQIANVKSGVLITIDQKPLDYWGKPMLTRRTGGQFLLFYPRYLNFLSYAPGQVITVAAVVEGTKLIALGDSEYDYPVLVSKELKLWPREQNQPEAQTQWGDPLYDPQQHQP